MATIDDLRDPEILRILRAAADGRLELNSGGRYVIAGEPRPAAAERRRCTDKGWIAWPCSDGKVDLTVDGRGALQELATRLDAAGYQQGPLEAETADLRVRVEAIEREPETHLDRRQWEAKPTGAEKPC